MKKNKFLYIILLIVLLVEIINVLFWLVHCKYFHSNLHIDLPALMLQLTGEINQDQGVPYIMTRLFHNKLIDLFLLTLKLYFRFWDFMLNPGLFSFVGTFGILVAGWHFFENKVKQLWQWFFVIVICMLPFAEIFFSADIPFLMRVGLYFIILVPVSLIGIRKFLMSWNKSFYVLVLLIILSVWWLLFADFDFVTYCIQYP